MFQKVKKLRHQKFSKNNQSQYKNRTKFQNQDYLWYVLSSINLDILGIEDFLNFSAYF